MDRESSLGLSRNFYLLRQGAGKKPREGRADAHIPWHTPGSPALPSEDVDTLQQCLFICHVGVMDVTVALKNICSEVYYGTKYGLGKNLDCLSVKQ